jgi:probable HAF family extracellular repeat protein
MNAKVLIGGALRAAVAFSLIAASAGAQVHYRLTDLGFAEAAAINSVAEVVGGGYIYSNGTVQYVPGGGDALAVNDSGEIAGAVNVSGGASHAFLYSNGTIQDLGTLGGSSSIAYCINNAGQVVGEADTASGACAFLYSSGTMTPLSVLSGASAINDSGQIAGWSGHAAVLYSNGVKTQIGPLAETAVSAINDAGQVVGVAFSPGPEQAFLWSAAAGIQHLGTLAAPFDYGSQAYGINVSGQVVGTSWSLSAGSAGPYFTYHAFVYSNGAMEDLNNLTSLPSGWMLEDATAINASGQICGWGNKGAFLLTPIEPGDANGDGRVDINDLTIVLANFGQTGMTWSQGCMDGDPTGTVDMNDLTLVLANYGYGATAAAGVKAVPEPAALALLLAALACLLASTHRPAHGKRRRLAWKL